MCKKAVIARRSVLPKQSVLTDRHARQTSGALAMTAKALPSSDVDFTVVKLID